jgi:hypothetical protein
MALTRRPPPGNVRRVICLGRNLCGVTTNKRGHVVQFESALEHTLLLLLERDATVADYRSQPELLHFRDPAGRARTYTPDFQVWRTDGQVEFHEVTVVARMAQRPALHARAAVAEAICRERGWRYVVHTDQTLPSGAMRANLVALSAFRAPVYADAAATAWWLDGLAGRGPVHPGAVLEAAGPDQPTGPLLTALYHLLWHGGIHMDWQQPLLHVAGFGATARIWWPAEVSR